MFRLGHKNPAVNKMQHTCFFLNTVSTGQGFPKEEGLGAGDSWDMDAGATLAMVLRGWKIPASQFRVWSSPEVLQAPLQ